MPLNVLLLGFGNDCLGHPSSDAVYTIINSSHTLSSTVIRDSYFCDFCALSKTHKLTSSHQHHKSSWILQLLYLDLWASPAMSCNGDKYFL